MRNLFAAIMAAIASMPRMVVRRVLEMGAWVERLFMEPAQPAAPQSEPLVNTMYNQSADDFGAIKRLAKSILGGSEPDNADLLATSDLTMSWLTSLDRLMLSKVALADDSILRGHIRGGQPMRGVVPHDPEAIADVQRARRSPDAVEQRRRVREQIEEYAGAPMMA